MSSSRPSHLADPAGAVVAHVVCDLTAYLPFVTVASLQLLVAWYRGLCPPDRFVHYAIPETMDWDDIDDPLLTAQGRAAEAAGEALPFLAPVRTRVAAGRPFHILFWDGLDTDCYCFNLRCVRDDAKKDHAFVRVTMPASVDPGVLLGAARELADNIPYLSGHGGYAFAYDPDRKFDAFTAIYPVARRYWGIDVEDLNETLPLMGSAIKGANWLTLLGAPFLETLAAETLRGVANANPRVQIEGRKHGLLIRAGSAPTYGDRHRPDPDFHALMAVGAALDPLIVRGHPTFSGDGFIDNDNTDGWFHRFYDPRGWS